MFDFGYQLVYFVKGAVITGKHADAKEALTNLTAADARGINVEREDVIALRKKAHRLGKLGGFATFDDVLPTERARREVENDFGGAHCERVARSV